MHHSNHNSDPLAPVVQILRKDNDALRERVKELLSKNLKVHQLEMNYEKICNDYDQVPFWTFVLAEQSTCR